MRSLRVILAACLSAALLATMLAMPATAATKGKLAIVQGWYGKRVDVCVNGKEVASAMRFGKVAYRKISPGPKVVKVFKADRRTCKGPQLAKRYFKLPAGSDKTMVVGKWKKPKQILVFDNTPPSGSVGEAMVLRHAADYGKVDIHRTIDWLPENPITPSSLAATGPLWSRGQEAWHVELPMTGPPRWITVWVSEEWQYIGTVKIAGPKFVEMWDQSRTEFIFIGRGDHTRLLALKRG